LTSLILFRDHAFAQRRAFGFLDDAVKHDDALANESAEKHMSYALSAL